MASELQQIASRTNGAKSHGPTTEEGKHAASRNSLNHGFNSKRIVLPGESQGEFDELLASYLDEHQPATPTERTLIENMAVARWRRQRVWTLETAGLTAEMRRPRYIEGEDPETQAFVAFRSLSEARSERQFRAALTAAHAVRRATIPARIAPFANAIDKAHETPDHSRAIILLGLL